MIAEDTYDASGEAGIMDYRYNPIIIEESEDRFTIRLTFTFMMHNSCDVEVPEGFEKTWCIRHSAEEIAEDIYDIVKPVNAVWIVAEDIATLSFEIMRDEDGYMPSEEDVYDSLIFNRLEDSVFDALPGRSFWVVSERNLEDEV